MIKGWKTVLTGALFTVVGGIEAGDYTNIIPNGYEELVVAIAGVVMILLRLVTTTPVGQKD